MDDCAASFYSLQNMKGNKVMASAVPPCFVKSKHELEDFMFRFTSHFALEHKSVRQKACCALVPIARH